MLEAKVDKQTGRLDLLQMQSYTVIALVVLGLALINADALPSTIIVTLIRKLLA